MQVFQVNSFTEPGKVYDVTKDKSPGRPWMCSCPSWIYAKRDPATGYKKDCKHITATSHSLMSVVAASALDHPTGAKVTVEGTQYRVRRPAAKLV